MKVVINQTIDVKPEDIFSGVVVQTGNGAVIRFHKKFIGKKVYIILRDE